MEIRAVSITKENFAAYGCVIHMLHDQEDVSHWQNKDFRDHMIEFPIQADEKLHIGITEGGAAPCEIVSMEKHETTHEMLLCGIEPVVLCVAESKGNTPPMAADIKAFLVEPGQAAIIRKNVWHDACHGIKKVTPYYWIAQACAVVEWVPVKGSAKLVVDDWLGGKMP